MKTYVYALIHNKEGFLALQKPPNSKCNPNTWGFPGGKLEEGETFKECVAREVLEETTLTFIPTLTVFDKIYKKENIRAIVFIGKTIRGKIKISHEHQAFKFIMQENISNFVFYPYVEEILCEKHE